VHFSCMVVPLAAEIGSGGPAATSEISQPLEPLAIRGTFQNALRLSKLSAEKPWFGSMNLYPVGSGGGTASVSANDPEVMWS